MEFKTIELELKTKDSEGKTMVTSNTQKEID